MVRDPQSSKAFHAPCGRSARHQKVGSYFWSAPHHSFWWCEAQLPMSNAHLAKGFLQEQTIDTFAAF